MEELLELQRAGSITSGEPVHTDRVLGDWQGPAWGQGANLEGSDAGMTAQGLLRSPGSPWRPQGSLNSAPFPDKEGTPPTSSPNISLWFFQQNSCEEGREQDSWWGRGGAVG